MEFPSEKKFNENKISGNSILKWRDIPTNKIFRVDDVSNINTKFGPATILTLVDRDLNKHRCWATKTISDRLGEINRWNESCYIKSLGLKKSSNDNGNSYYNFEIMTD